MFRASGDLRPTVWEAGGRLSWGSGAERSPQEFVSVQAILGQYVATGDACPKQGEIIGAKFQCMSDKLSSRLKRQQVGEESVKQLAWGPQHWVQYQPSTSMGFD